MNAVVYLFSLWLLVLSGLPCPDTDCCHAEKSHTTSSSTPASPDDHGHKAPCSPFCSCATCAGFAIPQLFHYVRPAELGTVIFSPKAFAYQSSGYADVARSVWQPPKV